MPLQCAARFQCSPLTLDNSLEVCRQPRATLVSSRRREKSFLLSSSKLLPFPLLVCFPIALSHFQLYIVLDYGVIVDSYKRNQHCDFRKWRYGSGRNAETMKSDDEDGLMDEEERWEMRKKIWDVIDNSPDFQEELDPKEKKRKMAKLLAEYPLVVEEEDPDWPEDADGRGFSLDQFFNKITIKNVKKEDDDENDDSDNEIVWQDDDYIRPIKDITASEWEENVFKDISPLIILVHNRYRRPKENERCRDELERAVNIIWNCRLPSPRCVAIDAVVDCDLVSALKVSVFPELIFTKSGKILYREKATRPAEELSKIMAFFYYGAAKPPFFDFMEDIEAIPSIPIST